MSDIAATCAATTRCCSSAHAPGRGASAARCSTCSSEWRVCWRTSGARSCRKTITSTEPTNAKPAMMYSCECHVPKKSSVAAAMPAATKLAPSEPHDQNANACARPTRGVKSRISGWVPDIATPSTNASRMRAAVNWPGVCDQAMNRQDAADRNIQGTMTRTRPTRSTRRPPMKPASAPHSRDAAVIRP